MKNMFDEEVNDKLTPEECLKKLCASNENDIYVDCKYFKHLMKHKMSCDYVTRHIENIFNFVLNYYTIFTLHICLKGITITDCDKYKDYAKDLSYKLYYLPKHEPENALQVLYLYNPSSIFTMLHRLIEMMCCIDVKNKIKMVK